MSPQPYKLPIFVSKTNAQSLAALGVYLGFRIQNTDKSYYRSESTIEHSLLRVPFRRAIRLWGDKRCVEFASYASGLVGNDKKIEMTVGEWRFFSVHENLSEAEWDHSIVYVLHEILFVDWVELSPTLNQSLMFISTYSIVCEREIYCNTDIEIFAYVESF